MVAAWACAANIILCASRKRLITSALAVSVTLVSSLVVVTDAFAVPVVVTAEVDVVSIVAVAVDITAGLDTTLVVEVTMGEREGLSLTGRSESPPPEVFSLSRVAILSSRICFSC